MFHLFGFFIHHGKVSSIIVIIVSGFSHLASELCRTFSPLHKWCRILLYTSHHFHPCLFFNRTALGKSLLLPLISDNGGFSFLLLLLHRHVCVIYDTPSLFSIWLLLLPRFFFFSLSYISGLLYALHLRQHKEDHSLAQFMFRCLCMYTCICCGRDYIHSLMMGFDYIFALNGESYIYTQGE